MSWFDDIVDFGKSVIGNVGDFLSGNSLGSNLAKTALIGYTLNKVTKSINKDNEAATSVVDISLYTDPGVKLQVNPDTGYKIPVLYGTSTFGGAVTDAWLTTDNQTMYFVLTLAERTGTLLSTSSASSYVFNDIYLNDNRLIFQSDGVTADYMLDRDGNQDVSIQDNVKVYCFAGNSDTPQVPEYYTNTSLDPAYDIMPNWTPSHDMNDLLFAIVRIDYVSDKGLKSLPNMKFTITNSMSAPGDCLYDMMTNTRYGAGIDPADIES